MTQDFDKTVLQLKDKDLEVRLDAVRCLGKLGDARAVEPLIATLKDEDWIVGWFAAQALGQIGDPQAVEPLIAALKDTEMHVRRFAAEALRQFGDSRAVQPLIAALKDETGDVRCAAAQALGQIGDSRAVQPLIATLKDEERDVCCAAARALGQIGDSRAVRPLIAILKDETGDVRQAAAWALEKIGAPAVEPLIAILKDEAMDMRQAAARALGRIGDSRAVRPLIAILKNEAWNVRQAAAWALRQIDEPAVRPLIAALAEEQMTTLSWGPTAQEKGQILRENVRQAAAEALRELDRQSKLSDLARQHLKLQPTVPHYSDVSFPAHTSVGQVEALRVAVTLKPITEQAVKLDLEPPPDKKVPMRVDACVVVSPLDFDLESPNVQIIEVPLDADSAPVIFKLLPKSIGRKTVAVEFFQSARYLGRAEVQTTVGEEIQESHLMSTQTTLGLSSTQLPPDLTILFDRVPVGEGRHYYRYRLLSYKRRLNLWFDEFHTPETTATPQKILEETFTHLNRMHSETIDNEALFFERLNSIGTSLYGRLFPDDLKALYWNKLRDRVKSIVIISYEPWMPWELVRPFHPETKQPEDGFLCEKFNLTRWLHGTAPPDMISLERLGLIAATSDLELTTSEAMEIRQLFGDKVEDVSPSGEAVFQLLKTGGFSGLHFACHGEYNAKDPDWSTLYLEEETTLCPIDIDGDKLVFGKDHPLVFLNACETGQGGYALTGMGGWAEAFVRRAKSSGFVGSIWEANSESAYKFAVTFYRHLLEGKTVAEAARLARQSIKRAGDPTWLSYTVYANPLARLSVEEAASP
jgi:HEAT repeat protein